MNYLSAGVQELIGLHCKLSDPSSGLAMGVQLIHGLQLTGGSLINVYIYMVHHAIYHAPYPGYHTIIMVQYGRMLTYIYTYNI